MKFWKPKKQSWDRKIGLVLPGGGARGAYQVGVLKAIAEILPRRAPNPFAVISGTSAGAVSSAVLASRARLFRYAVADLERVWGGFHSHHVFRSDAWTMLRTGSHWVAALALGGLGVRAPRSMLDNQPLRELLKRNIHFDAIQESIDKGYLDALAITAAGYGSARSISFYQGREELQPWERARRRGQPAKIAIEHLMASIAVPLIFPTVQMGREYFGDGAMRQATPLSPAVRLGAERLLVIGVRDEGLDPLPGPDEPVPYPTVGGIAGYMLDALFMDGLSSDLERLTRINLILDSQSDRKIEGPFGKLSFIDAFIVLPSEDIREIAIRHIKEMPRSVRLFMKGIGALNYGGRQLVSYLLFESGYTRELIELGYKDGMNRRDELQAFMEGKPTENPAGIIGWENLSTAYSQNTE